MFFDKQIDQGYFGNVAYANGSVRFQSVKLNVYSYVFDGIAIDAGSHSLKSEFQSFFSNKKIDGLYCTHIHEDHTGCASWLQQQNIPVYIHKNSILEASKDGKYPLYRQIFWGKRRAFKARPIPETFTSHTYNWRSIFTPGHSADHMVFLNTSTGQLFSGDLFVQVRTKVIMDSESIPQIIKSIEDILKYDFDEVFCNHAGYMKDGKKKFKEKLEYLYELTDRIQQLHKQGKTVKEIHQLVFPHKYPITMFSLGQWDSKHIVTSILE